MSEKKNSTDVYVDKFHTARNSKLKAKIIQLFAKSIHKNKEKKTNKIVVWCVNHKRVRKCTIDADVMYGEPSPVGRYLDAPVHGETSGMNGRLTRPGVSGPYTWQNSSAAHERTCSQNHHASSTGCVRARPFVSRGR